MIPPPFRYHRATSASHAAALLDEIPGSVLLAGGQTLVNALKLNLLAPAAVIDIHHLDELRAITMDGDSVVIGSAVTYAELAASVTVRLHLPALTNACVGLVDRQVRNRGTIGGNACLNDPTSNLPPLLATLDATFSVLTHRGVHTFSAEEFFQGTLRTAASGAVLESVTLPVTSPQTRVFYRHQQVGADSWAIARVVGSVTLSEGEVADVRLYLAAVPGSPVRLRDIEAALQGADMSDPQVLRSVLAAFDADPTQFEGDSHGSAQYRRHLARIQLKRVVDDIAKEVLSA